MNESQKTISHQNDWSFLPTTLSGFIGVGIGLMIAYYLGWF